MAGNDRYVVPAFGQGFGEIGEQLARGRFIGPIEAVDKDHPRGPRESVRHE
jgi:hypothetical protein